MAKIRFRNPADTKKSGKFAIFWSKMRTRTYAGMYMFGDKGGGVPQYTPFIDTWTQTNVPYPPTFGVGEFKYPNKKSSARA